MIEVMIARLERHFHVELLRAAEFAIRQLFEPVEHDRLQFFVVFVASDFVHVYLINTGINRLAIYGFFWDFGGTYT